MSSLAPAGLAPMLDAFAARAVSASLHTADPGMTGGFETSGGGYGRVGVGWRNAAGGSVRSSGPVTWTAPAGTFTHVGYWDASGVWLGSSVIPGTRVLTTAGTVRVGELRIAVTDNLLIYADDELRVLLHKHYGVQSQLRLDEDTAAICSFSSFDEEQGVFNLVSPHPEVDPIAVARGAAASSYVIGPDSKGEHCLAMNQDGRLDATMRFIVPAMTDGTKWVLEGRIKGASGLGQRLYRGSSYGWVAINGSGSVSMYWDAAETSHTTASTINALIGYDPGDELWWRVTSDGAAMKLEMSLDGSSYTTFHDVVMDSPNDMTDNYAMFVGLSNFVSGSHFHGRYYDFRLRDGTSAASPVLANMDLESMFPPGNRSNGATGRDSSGTQWISDRPDWTAGTDLGWYIGPKPYPRIAIPAGDPISEAVGPPSANAAVGGQHSFRWDIEPESWTSHGGRLLSNGCYPELWSGGTLRFGYYDGAGFPGVVSAAHGITSGRWHIRMDFDSTTGSVSFYKRAPGLPIHDDLDWTLINTTSTSAGSIQFTASPEAIGLADGVAGSEFKGDALAYCRKNNGAVAAHWDAADAVSGYVPASSSWVDPITGAEITIYRNTSAQYHVYVIPANRAALATDGVNDNIRFTGDDRVSGYPLQFTYFVDCLVPSASNYTDLISGQSASGGLGANIEMHGTLERVYGRYSDGTNIIRVGDNADNITFGKRFLASAAFSNVANSAAFVDGVRVEGPVTTPASSVQTGQPVTLGATPASGSRTPALFFGAAVVHRLVDSLTDQATIYEDGLDDGLAA